MDRPGTWDEAEAVSAGPIRNPDSGEIGQGKEIGDQEVTQTRGPENCGQNLQDPGHAALGTERCLGAGSQAAGSRRLLLQSLPFDSGRLCRLSLVAPSGR